MDILGRHWRLVALVLGIIIVFWVLYLLRTVVLPFALGLVLAYILMPAISWLEKKLPRQGSWTQFKRVLSIYIVFIVFFGGIALFSYYIVTVVMNTSVILVEHAPYFIAQSLSTIQEWFEGLRRQLPLQIQQQVDKALVEAGVALGNAIRDAFVKGISSMPRTFGMFFGFAALPFFLFYSLKDSEKLEKGFYSALAPGAAEHIRNVVLIVEKVLGRYVRAQLMLGVIVAYFVFVGLLILGIQFAPALAMVAGVTELIPTLGPWIGGGVAVMVTMAVAPGKWLWVALLFLIVQLFENNFLVPRIQGAYLRIHPAVLIVLLVVGTYLAGFWGLLLAGPLSATAVEIYRYVLHCYRLAETVQPPS